MIKPNNKINNELSLNYVPTVLHQCKICAKEFKTGQALGSHMRIHRLGKGLNVVEEKGLSQHEAEKENIESDLESGSSVLTVVELHRHHHTPPCDSLIINLYHTRPNPPPQPPYAP